MLVTREQLNALLEKLHVLIDGYEYGIPLYDSEKMFLARQLIRSELGLEGNEAVEEQK